MILRANRNAAFYSGHWGQVPLLLKAIEPRSNKDKSGIRAGKRFSATCKAESRALSKTSPQTEIHQRTRQNPPSAELAS
jgi:hypothetical protein